jgi:DNA-directed RNA polymerase subunit omega
MMSSVSIEELLKKVSSPFKLVILASKRALELADGAPKLVETNSKRFSTIALEEIAKGKVTYKTKYAHRKKKEE